MISGMETSPNTRQAPEFKDALHLAMLVVEARQMTSDGRARQLRQAARLTQAEVAEVCGVKPETVNRWEAGDRTPSGEPCRRFAVLLANLAALQAAQQPDPAHGGEPPGLA